MANTILVLLLTLALGPGVKVLGRQVEVGDKYYDAGGEGRINVQSKAERSSWNKIDVADVEEDESFSSWELHVLNDLMIELSLIRCSGIDKRDARVLKRAISLKISQMYREDQTMNPTFYKTYQKLTHCMEFLTERLGIDERISITKEGMDGAVAESQPDVAEVPAPTRRSKTTTPTTKSTTLSPEKARVVEKDGSESEDLRDKPLAGLERIMVSTMKWLKSILENNQIWKIFGNGGNETERMKRSAKDGSGSRGSVTERGYESSREEGKVVADLQKLFAMFGRILINSCPKKDKPSLEFTRRSIHEIVLATVSQPYGVLSNSQLLGPASKLWKQVKDCVAISSARNPTDAALVMDERASINA